VVRCCNSSVHCNTGPQQNVDDDYCACRVKAVGRGGVHIIAPLPHFFLNRGPARSIYGPGRHTYETKNITKLTSFLRLQNGLLCGQCIRINTCAYGTMYAIDVYYRTHMATCMGVYIQTQPHLLLVFRF